MSNGHRRSERLGRLVWLFDLAFFLSLVVLPAAWLMTPLDMSAGPVHIVVPWSAKLLAAPPVLLLARFAINKRFARHGLWERPLFKQLSLTLASTFLFFFGIEQCLKLMGYEAHVPPVVIVGEKETDVKSEALYLNDPRLLFRFRPGAEFKGQVVNRLGFFDREVDPAKKPGTMRVICMGDSVSGQGSPPYSGHLNAKLTTSPPTTNAWESFNMAVHGYTAVQGLRLFQLQARDLKPDFVVILYGWNDHWLSPLPDSSRMAREMSPGRATLLRILRMKRFGQLLLSMTGRRSMVQRKNESGVRVPPQEYERTLAQFAAEVRAAGAVPILMTAPRGRTLSRRLVHARQAASVDEAIRAHDQYNDIARRVAQETDTPLIDLAKKLAAGEDAPLFSDDGIHFNSPAGIILIADEVYGKIVEMTKGR